MKATILNTVYDPAPEKIDGHKWPNLKDRPSLSMVPTLVVDTKVVSVSMYKYMHPYSLVERVIRRKSLVILGLYYYKNEIKVSPSLITKPKPPTSKPLL